MPHPRFRLFRHLAPVAIFLALAGMGQAQQAELPKDLLLFQTPGAPEDLRDRLRAASGLVTSKKEDLTDPQDLFAAARADYGRLLAALYGEGYYSGTIRILIDGREAADIAPLDAPDRIRQVTVVVQPGPQFRFATTSLAPLPRKTNLPDSFASGEIARSGTIQEATRAGIEAWRDQGRAKARVADQSLVADHARARVDADIRLDPGPRLRFGRLSITGAKRMDPARIRQIAGLPEGQVFSPAALERSASRLRRSGVFRSVTLTEAETPRSPDLLDIDATLVEDRPRRYSFGAELATLEGVNLTGYWLHRNLLGGAERLRIDGSIANIGADTSGMDYRLGVTLDRPATFTPDTTLSLGAEIGRIQDVWESYDDLTLTVALNHVFSERLSGSAGLSYEYALGRDTNGSFAYRNLSLPLGLTWDSRDSATDAAKGLYVAGEVKPFYGLGTTGSGARLTLDARAYRGFGDRRRLVLAGRLQMGSIYGARLSETPRDFLFYSGGGGTVRGQPYQSLGVNVLRDGTDRTRSGGSLFLGTSLEARFKVTDRIGLVGFMDLGRVGINDLSDGGWHSGAGLGLRYGTPVGPIRLDIAAPTGGQTGSGVQLYVGLGQAF